MPNIRSQRHSYVAKTVWARRRGDPARWGWKLELIEGSHGGRPSRYVISLSGLFGRELNFSGLGTGTDRSALSGFWDFSDDVLQTQHSMKRLERHCSHELGLDPAGKRNRYNVAGQITRHSGGLI